MGRILLSAQGLNGAVLLQVNSSYAAEVAAGNFTGVSSIFEPITSLAAKNPETMTAKFVPLGTFPSYYSWYTAVITDVAIGIDVLVGSRLLDRDVFTNQAEALVNYLYSKGSFSGTFNMGEFAALASLTVY